MNASLNLYPMTRNKRMTKPVRRKVTGCGEEWMRFQSHDLRLCLLTEDQVKTPVHITSGADGEHSYSGELCLSTEPPPQKKHLDEKKPSRRMYTMTRQFYGQPINVLERNIINKTKDEKK